MENHHDLVEGLAFLQVPFVSFAVCGGACHVMAQWRLS